MHGYHLNGQNVFKKKEQLCTKQHDLCQNFIFYSNETWIFEFDDMDIFITNKQQIFFFRTDRVSLLGLKTKKSVDMF